MAATRDVNALTQSSRAALHPIGAAKSAPHGAELIAVITVRAGRPILTTPRLATAASEFAYLIWLPSPKPSFVLEARPCS